MLAMKMARRPEAVKAVNSPGSVHQQDAEFAPFLLGTKKMISCPPAKILSSIFCGKFTVYNMVWFVIHSSDGQAGGCGHISAITRSLPKKAKTNSEGAFSRSELTGNNEARAVRPDASAAGARL